MNKIHESVQKLEVSDMIKNLRTRPKSFHFCIQN